MIQKILIADDEPDVLTMLSEIFSHYGYDVVTASNAEAFERVLDRDPRDHQLLEVISEHGQWLAHSVYAKRRGLAGRAYLVHYLAEYRINRDVFGLSVSEMNVGDFIKRLAVYPKAHASAIKAQFRYLQEEAKSLPWGAVWDMYCLQSGVPVGESYIAEIEKYESDVTSRRQ